MLQPLIKTMLFPTAHIKGDWYKSKGYNDFHNYLSKQRENIKQPLNGVLNDVDVSQYNVNAYNTKGKKHLLEAVEIKMKEDVKDLPYDKKSLACRGKHIVVFLGRSEFYQYDLRDLSIEALKTGATVHGFNYSGMYASTGEAKCFEDLVNDGFAVVHRLIKEKNISPNDIILQGNCLGSAVAEAVARKIDEHYECNIRQINSNSFKSIKAVITYQYPFFKFLQNLLKKILAYTGWDIKPGKNFNKTTPYSCYIHRTGDKTIGDDAKVHAKIEKHKDNDKSNDNYGDYNDTRKKLDDNSEMSEARDWKSEEWKEHYKESWLPKDKLGNILSGTKYNDPHELHLYQLKTNSKEKGMETMFDFINTFVRESDRYIQARHDVDHVAEKVRSNTKSLQQMSRKLTKKEKIEFSKNEKDMMNSVIKMVKYTEQQSVGRNNRLDGGEDSNANILNAIEKIEKGSEISEQL